MKLLRLCEVQRLLELLKSMEDFLINKVRESFKMHMVSPNPAAGPQTEFGRGGEAAPEEGVATTSR